MVSELAIQHIDFWLECLREREREMQGLPVVEISGELDEGITAQPLIQIHLVYGKCILLLHATPSSRLLL